MTFSTSGGRNAEVATNEFKDVLLKNFAIHLRLHFRLRGHSVSEIPCNPMLELTL